MQTLTDDIKAWRPGVTIWGIGDADHQLRTSGHNEDDTSGVRAELSDADTIPEHRAIDVKINAYFSKIDADGLVARMLRDPNARARLYYIIWYGYSWSRNGGWVKKVYTGSNQHTGHAHFSGWAEDDANTAHWPAVKPAPPLPVHRTLSLGMSGTDVRHVQEFLRTNFPAYRSYVLYLPGQLLQVTGYFGAQTKSWVVEFQRRTSLQKDGVVGPLTLAKLRGFGYDY